MLHPGHFFAQYVEFPYTTFVWVSFSIVIVIQYVDESFLNGQNVCTRIVEVVDTTKVIF